VPINAVRMRRDFRQLLSAIKAVALLYQRQRARTPSGEIEATLEDYATVRDLLLQPFTTAATSGLTPAIRETVEAVSEGEELNVTELSRRMRLPATTVAYRVGRALGLGYLADNSPGGKGRPARLVRAAPLPVEAPALPSVEELYEYTNRIGKMVRPPSPPSTNGHMARLALEVGVHTNRLTVNETASEAARLSLSEQIPTRRAH
jgi:hypothetical protein